MRQFADLLRMTASLLFLTLAIGLLSSGKALATTITTGSASGGSVSYPTYSGQAVLILNGEAYLDNYINYIATKVRNGDTLGNTMMALVPNGPSASLDGYGATFIFGTIGNSSLRDPVSAANVSCSGATVDDSTYDALDVQISMYSSCELYIETDGGQNFTATLARSVNGYSLSSGTYNSTTPTTDNDGELTASATVTEPVGLDTTVDTVGEAVDVFDFTLTDGGSGDGLAMTISEIVVNVSGTANDTHRSNITWRLNGPDASNVTGTYNSGTDTITFSGLSISVSDGASDTYAINAYFNDNTNVSEDLTVIMSIDGDTDLTIGSSGTQMGSTSAVTNGTGTTLDVVATQLAFTTQPAGSTSGSSLTTQPVVAAQDAAGNTDTDFTGTVTLTESAAGTLSGSSSMSAVSGVASFTGLTYTATADQQEFALTASSGTLSFATANTIKSNVVATTLAFTTQPAPTSFPGKQSVSFTTVPVVQAVDANSVVDTDFTGTVSLTEVAGAGSATFSNESVSAVAGVATFTGLGLTYTNSGSTTETFKLEASATGLSSVQSSELTARLAPSVTGVSSNTTDGSYKADETVSIQVAFSEDIIVSGSPQLTLETGSADRIATYVTGSGTSTLTLTYSVQAGDTAADLDYKGTDALSLNGGTITSKADGTDAILTLATPGATGSLGAANALVIDTTDPAGYSASLDQDPINDGNKSSVSFTFADAEVGANYSFTISSSGGGTNVTGSGTIATATDQITGIDVSGLGDGTLTLSVALTDAAGNVGSAATDTSSKDASLPNGHTLAFDQSTVNDGNKNAISFTFADAEVGANYSFTISSSGGGTNVTGSGTIATATDQITGIDVSGLGDGTLTLSVALTDAAGNSASAVTDTVVKDALTPDAPSTPVLAEASNSGSTGDNLTNNATPTITGTAESSATVEIFVGSISVGTSTADGSGNWSFTFAAQDLASGTNSITTKATDAAGNTSAASAALVITLDADAPTVTITGPTDVVTTDFMVTLTFSEVVTGFAADDITVTNGAKGTFTETTPGKVFTLVVTPELGTTVSVSVAADKAQDAAGNGNEASDVFEVSAGSPASEFEKESADIKKDIVAEVQNTLQNAVTANVRMVKEAKSRFITSTRSSLNGTAGFAGQNNVPFDVDGVANGTAMRLSTNGTFFGQAGNDEGTKRRVFFGDFSIVGEKGGSVTGSISGKVAWEQNLSDKTMYGYFVGAQVNQTDIKTTFTGKQQGYGVNIGSYVVNEVAENVYIDGFVSLGMGKSDLDMSNDVLSLDGSYETKSATIGGALTGVYDMESYEFWPELAFTAGKTQVGTAKFTGRAYGLVDNNLSLDAGDVTVANLTLRPEVRIPLEAGNQSGATSQVTFAPRAICERITTDVTTENCGRGAELGFIRRSGDGFTQITGRLSRDYVGTSTRTGVEFKLEHRF